MKYTIEGFSQAESVNRGLDVKDLVLLRWMVDFQTTGRMQVLISDNQQWYWIHYPYVIQELPILGINHRKVLARRIKNLQVCGVIDVRNVSSRMYFRFVKESMFMLLSDTEKQNDLFSKPRKRGYAGQKSPQGNSKVPWGGTQKFRSGVLLSSPYNDSSINDSSINDSKQPKKKAAVKDLPYEPITEEQTVRINELAGKIGKRFNIFMFMQKVSKSIGYPPPPNVMIKACEGFLKYPQIKNAWGWFVKVVRSESGAFFAELNIKEHDQYKKETPNIGKVMQDMGINV